MSDRHDERATRWVGDVGGACWVSDPIASKQIAALLRKAAREALERAASEAERWESAHAAARAIRALIQPEES